MTCICGEPLKWIRDPTSYGFAGLGDLRCVKCGRSSGLCKGIDATHEFNRRYRKEFDT
jgi:hypothetical protein